MIVKEFNIEDLNLHYFIGINQIEIDIRKILEVPFLEEIKAIFVPSGDHRGEKSALGLEVSWTGEPPESGISQTSLLNEFFFKSGTDTV